jgi:hypothetical protein
MHHQAISKLALVVLCGSLVGCAPSHPTYSYQTLLQVATYLDAHCPADSRGIKHYFALTIADGRLNLEGDREASSRLDQFDADERQLDRLLAICTASTSDTWAHDAANLMVASDSQRESYGCTTPTSFERTELDHEYLCQRDITSNRAKELDELEKTSQYADIRSVAELGKKQADKELLDEECALSPPLQNIYKPKHCAPDPWASVKP